MATNATPMSPEDVALLREVERRAGSPKAASECLGVSRFVLSNALNGWPVSPFIARYLHDSLPNVLARLGDLSVERAG